MTGEAIFLMKDLHRYLADAAVARKCLDLAPAFGHDRRVIVMSAVRVELPSELEPLTARFTLDLPGAEELKSVDTGRSPDLDRLVDRLRGFTTFEAERAITQAILRDNTLDARDIDLIVEIKKEMLRRLQAPQGVAGETEEGVESAAEEQRRVADEHRVVCQHRACH